MKNQELLEAVYGYLPHKVKIKILNHLSDYVGIEYSHITGHYILNNTPHFTYEGGSTGKSFFEIRLLLRPLSDLLDIENDLRYELADIIGVISVTNFVESLMNEGGYNLTTKKWIEAAKWLDEKHFDWKSDLIGEGVAIDL